MNESSPLDAGFRQALAAVDAADLVALEHLLTAHPRLSTDRLETPGAWLRTQIGPALDSFFARPYLLWFLTEDAPRTGALAPNVGDLARAIIAAARRNGAATLQEQLDTTLHFTVCSPIGRDDGRQLALLDALVEAGASLDGAPVQALICHNRAAAEHLLRRGARLEFAAAVCLERWAEVARLGPTADPPQRQLALALAAHNGVARGVAELVRLGVDVSAFSTGFYTHATPLHHAVWAGSLDTVRVLVEAGANVTIRDLAENATPLGWAEYARTRPGGDGRAYAAIASYLRSLGAPP